MRIYTFINSKKMLFSFSFLMIGIAASLLSPIVSHNLWNNLLGILTDKWFIIMFFLSISFLISDFYEMSSNSNLILRSHSLEKYMKDNIINIFKIVYILMFAGIFIFILGSIIIASRDFSFIIYKQYSIPLWIYCIFLFIRNGFFLSLLAIILYFIEWNYGKTGTSLFCLSIVILLLFGIDLVNMTSINNFTSIPLLVTSYFKEMNFSNIFLELSGSIVQIILLGVIISIIFNNKFIKNQKEKIKCDIN